MKASHLFSSLLLALSSSALLVACSSDYQEQEHEASEPAAIEQGRHDNIEAGLEQYTITDLEHYSEDDMDQLLMAIRRAAGVPRAERLESCQLLEVGAKPCGGPERLVLYSTEVADEAHLKALAARYTELAKLRNEREGLVSDCAVLERPRLSLEGGLCIPRTLANM